jgi:hypothetical protein
LSGRIRFGVRKHSSFLSFVEEPYTRFNVTSEVGDQYKLKNIPKVSSLIINKLKKHIRTKLIYPGSFKLRLIWPRKWWPPGGEHLFKSETKEPEASTTTATPVVEKQKSSAIDTTEALLRTPIRSPSKRMTVDEVLTNVNSEHDTLLQRWFWNTSSKPHENGPIGNGNGITKTPNRNEIFGEPGVLRMVDRRRYKSDTSIASPSTPRSGSVAHPDHVRLYVSDLLENDTIANPYFMNRISADDLMVGDKFSMGTESVAIMRSRSHSISDFRHRTLESMWSEFLGSIGHDFSLLTTQKKAAAYPNGMKSIQKENTVREFRLFSIQLSSFRKKLRRQNKIIQNPAHKPSKPTPATPLGNFSGFGFSFLSGNNIPKVGEKRNLLHEMNQLDSSTSSSTFSNTSSATMDQYYSNKFGRVVDILSSSRTTTHTANSMDSSSSSQHHHDEGDDLEQDAVNFAWQAQAEAITQAAARGEHLNMQNFLKTPKSSSTKSWVVMRDGNLTIYPNISIVSDHSLEKNHPTATYSLRGSICRPLDHHSGFEVGFVVMKEGKSVIEWVRFWTESNIQCRAWIMALQHSANFRASS